MAESIDQKLLVYLREQLGSESIDYQSPPQQLQGGFETQIFRFELKGAPAELSHPLILRPYPARDGGSNARWESSIQNALASASYPVAKAYLLCTDRDVLGCAFIVMDSLPGELLGKTAPKMRPWR